MKDSRYPPPDAAGKGEEYMKKDLKRQIITALAVTAVLGAAGGMTAQAANADRILVKQETIKDKGYGVDEGSSYWYGVVGGNAYLDSTAQYEGESVDGGLKGTVKALEDLAKMGNVDLSDVTDVLDKTESANAGKDTTIGGDAGLSTAIAEDINPSVVRFYGAVGGDLSLNTGLRANGEDGGLNLTFTGGQPQSLLLETADTSIVRNGDIVNNLGGKDEKENILSGGSFIGGVGGSAAAALGNITVEGSYSKEIIPGSLTATVSADLKLDGKTSATVNGNVVTNVAKDTNVIGWTNGGLAAGIGGTASSTVTGDTTLTIDGTDRTVRTEGFETPGTSDKIPQFTTALNVMEGSGISAIGVTGGGTAVTTLGGKAEATVGGSATVNVNNATVIGVIGGGAAASVDATGVVDLIRNNGSDSGNDNKTADVTGKQLEDLLGTKIPDNLTITATDAIDGGTAESTTGDTNITLTGKGTALGVLGGGAAVASHTYTWKNDGTVPSEDTPEGVYKGGEYGSSNATAKTGKSHIIINLNNDGLDGAAKSAMLSSVKSFVTKVVEDTNNLQSNELEALHNKGAAIGVFGGGAAIAQSGNQQFAGENAGKDLSDTYGAFATATTAGSDIELADGYIVGVMGGGIAAVDNNAAASSNMNGTVNITIGGYEDEEGNELDPEVVGVFGNGLAYFTGSSDSGNNNLKGQAVVSAEDTNILVRGGSVDGIIGGGVAIDDSQSNVTNASAVTNGTAAITVTGGTVNTVNLDTISSITYVDGVKAAAGNAAIAAGGIALGGGAETDVANAMVTISGKDTVVNGDIYAGGITAYGYTETDGEQKGSHVGTSTINLNGGTVTGNVYAGGAASSMDLKDGGGYTYASATVDTAVINLAGTTVDGILYGTGTVTDADNAMTVSENDDSINSTLNVIGTNTLSTVKPTDGSESSKIQKFDAVNFKAGSETIVKDLTAGEGGTALISGGKVTVEDGASLNVEALDNATGTYKIADQTADTSTFWKDSDLIYDRMGGYYATGVIGDSNGSYDVNVAEVTSDNANEAADSMTDALGVKDLRGMFREGMNDGWKKLNKDSGAGKYLDDWQMADNKAPYQKGMLFGEDAAVTGNTVSIARAMADNVTQRLSFTDDYVQEQGWANQDGGVWAKYMHRKYETDGMSSSVGGIRSSTDYDGVLVGMDLAKSGKFQSGVAIHYGSGEGDGLISHNDYDAWGITLYGSLKDEEAGTNLMADIGWMTSDNDIDGTVNGTRMSADRDVDTWTIGIRGEKEFVSGKNQIVPYAGLRYMSVNPGSYTTYYNGQAAFHNDAENQDLWLLPIGVSFRNETVTSSGWRITPKLDLSYIWAFGDTDTDMTVNASGYTGNLYYDVMDDSSWLATLGVEAEKDAWTFGINYGYQKGDDTKNKTWYVTAGYSF